MRRTLPILLAALACFAPVWADRLGPEAIHPVWSRDRTHPHAPHPPIPAEETVIGGRDVTLWRPIAAGATPVVFFSAGLGSCATASAFLTSALAEAGYLVIAPRHADAGCATPRQTPPPHPEASFFLPAVWSDTTWRDRREDIAVLWEALRHDSVFAGRIDRSKLAVMGHSVGGYVALGLAGAWPGWRLPEVRAVVALSPSCAPFLTPEGGLATLSAPVGFQGGTRDVSITPMLIRPGGCFDRIRGPAHLVVFRHADHYAWIDPRPRAREAMIAYTLAFLDTHLRGAPPDALSRRRHGVTLLWNK